MNYYDLNGDPISLEEWVSISQDTRILASDTVNGHLVSTVWLGIDHNFNNDDTPLIFETMIFRNDEWEDRYCERYPNRHAALAGHDRAVEEAKRMSR